MPTKHHEHVVPNLRTGVRFYFSSVSTSGYVPFHWHSSLELVCVLKGALRFNLDGQIYHLKENQFVLVPSGGIHDVTNQPNQAFVLQIPLQVVSPYFDHPERVQFLNGQTQLPEYQTIIRLVTMLGQASENHLESSSFDFGIALLQILRLMFTTFKAPLTNRHANEQMKEILIYVNDHPHEAISVNQLATHFGYNPSYLSRMFKEQMGLSLTNYGYETKLSRLYDDLIHRDESITALMEQNGLKNPRTARKIFVDMYGCLPKEIQKRHRQQRGRSN